MNSMRMGMKMKMLESKEMRSTVHAVCLLKKKRCVGSHV